MTNQQVRRVCTADSVSALASDSQTVGADPAGLALSAVCCTLLYPYYNREAMLSCVVSGRGVWYLVSVYAVQALLYAPAWRR